MFENPGVFCWSKMGSEAGESLSEIIQRKEIERLANDGVFLWGVGSSLGSSLKLLKQKAIVPTVLFTSMLSKAKYIDEHPQKIFMWTSYYDEHGRVCALPKYSFLTSRGFTPSQTKKKNHYALICRSSISIANRQHSILDGSTLVNLKSGKKVGASQVTSIVKKSSEIQLSKKTYKVIFSAELQNEGQVRLANFIEITLQDVMQVQEAARLKDIAAWKEIVYKLKSDYKKYDWDVTLACQQLLPIVL